MTLKWFEEGIEIDFWASGPDCPKAGGMFSLEFNEQTWTCRFLCFYLFGQFVPCYIRPSAFGHMITVNLLLHVLTDCSVSCPSKRFLFDILHRM